MGNPIEYCSIKTTFECTMAAGCKQEEIWGRGRFGEVVYGGTMSGSTITSSHGYYNFSHACCRDIAS